MFLWPLSPIHKSSSKSVTTFLRYTGDQQTGVQTPKQRQRKDLNIELKAGFTAVLNFLDAHLDDGRDESVLSLDKSCQVNAKHPLYILHVWQTVVGHFL